MSDDPLEAAIWATGELRSRGDSEALAVAIRSRFRVIPEDAITRETQTRSYRGWCQHEFQVTHTDVDPCP
jgi:hypothetical protein